GRLGALRRLELEHAEQLAADLFVTGAVFPLGEVGHQYGHEEPGTQRRALLLADAVQLAGEVQTLAGHYRPVEVQVGVHRHHRRIAVGLDDLEDLEVVFLARALGEVFLVQPAHAPHLQHAGGRDDVCIPLGAGEFPVGVQRVGDPHDLAPLPDHGCIHRIPGVDATVLAPDHG